MLEERLLGVYLRGSLATGDFDPETSDLDLLCVVAPLTVDEAYALRRMHERLSAAPGRYDRDVEVIYLPLDSAGDPASAT